MGLHRRIAEGRAPTASSKSSPVFSARKDQRTGSNHQERAPAVATGGLQGNVGIVGDEHRCLGKVSLEGLRYSLALFSTSSPRQPDGDTPKLSPIK